jgi:hypothetical protein
MLKEKSESAESLIDCIQVIEEDEITDRQLEALAIEIRETSKKSFYLFAKYVLGLSKLSDNHREWCDDLQKNWHKYYNFMRLKPRGTYKTSIYGIALILWVWATISKEIRILYASSNFGLLAEVSDAIKNYLRTDSLYSRVFDVYRDNDSKNTDDIFNINGRGVQKGFSLVLRTAGGATTGIHPNLIIIDDPNEIKDRTSPAHRRQKVIWYDSLIPLLVRNEKFKVYHKMYIATRYHMDDLTAYIVKQNQKSERSRQSMI